MLMFLPQRISHLGEMGQSVSGTGEQSRDYGYDPAREREGATSTGGDEKGGERVVRLHVPEREFKEGNDDRV